VQPLNKSAIFLREKDIIISSDNWHIALDLNTRNYEDAIATICSDLETINSHHKEFTPVVELKLVEASVDTLESRLREFQQLFPRLDKRRGLVNLGGSVLKSLFGTATVADLHNLHVTLEELKSKEAVISHTLNGQISYIKGIALNSRVNSDAIANLSTIFRTEVIQLHNRYARLSSDAFQFNVTFVDYSSLTSLVRQIEFSLLQMTSNR
jgi:hypothetical protein